MKGVLKAFGGVRHGRVSFVHLYGVRTLTASAYAAPVETDSTALEALRTLMEVRRDRGVKEAHAHVLELVKQKNGFTDLQDAAVRNHAIQVAEEAGDFELIAQIVGDDAVLWTTPGLVKCIASAKDPFRVWNSIRWNAELRRGCAAMVVRHMSRLNMMDQAIVFFKSCFKAEVLLVDDMKFLCWDEATPEKILALDHVARYCKVDASSICPNERLQVAYKEVLDSWTNRKWLPHILVAIENGATSVRPSGLRYVLGKWWAESQKVPQLRERILRAAATSMKAALSSQASPVPSSSSSAPHIAGFEHSSLQERFVSVFVVGRDEVMSIVEQIEKEGGPQALLAAVVELIHDRVSLPVSEELFLEVMSRLESVLTAPQKRFLECTFLCKSSRVSEDDREISRSVDLARSVKEILAIDPGFVCGTRGWNLVRQVVFLLSVDAVERDDVNIQLEALMELLNVAQDKQDEMENEFLRLRMMRKLIYLRRHNEILDIFPGTSPARVFNEMVYHDGAATDCLDFAEQHNITIKYSGAHFNKFSRWIAELSKSDPNIAIRSEICHLRLPAQRKWEQSLLASIQDPAALWDKFKKPNKRRIESSKLREKAYSVFCSDPKMREALIQHIKSSHLVTVDELISLIRAQPSSADALDLIPKLVVPSEEMSVNEMSPRIFCELALACARDWNGQDANLALCMYFARSGKAYASFFAALGSTLLGRCNNADMVVKLANAWYAYDFHDTGMFQDALERFVDNAAKTISRIRANHNTYGSVVASRLASMSFPSHELFVSSTVQNVSFEYPNKAAIAELVRKSCGGYLPKARAASSHAAPSSSSSFP